MTIDLNNPNTRARYDELVTHYLADPLVFGETWQRYQLAQMKALRALNAEIEQHGRESSEKPLRADLRAAIAKAKGDQP